MAIPAETFFLDPTVEDTLQQQIQRMVIEGILAGRFQPGDKLPSSRKLASHLRVSRITVTLAYNELLSNDYLISRGRSGYFVSPNAPAHPRFNLPQGPKQDAVNWKRRIGGRFSSETMPEKPKDWRRYPYPFIYGQADDRIFDHSNWRMCALQALGKKEFATVTEDFFERDDPELVKHIALRTLPRRGILAAPEEILITLGAQNALWLCAQILLGKDSLAVMENPGYPGLRAILNMTGCQSSFVDVDHQGMRFEYLADNADVVFATPSHHCPTNATMPLDRRRALLDHAAENDLIIVEDDYEFEMSFLNAPVPALKSLDHEGRVLYVGSFSKSLFPGLRLGYIVGPEHFIREARALRAAMLRHPPGHIQRTAATFLSLGHYDALVRRMSEIFAERYKAMDEAIREQGLTIASSNVPGGSSFWMRAPDHVDTAELALRLQSRGVLIEPGHVFFEDHKRMRNYYRIAYSSIALSQIADGIAIIADEIDKSGLN